MLPLAKLPTKCELGTFQLSAKSLHITTCNVRCHVLLQCNIVNGAQKNLFKEKRGSLKAHCISENIKAVLLSIVLWFVLYETRLSYKADPKQLPMAHFY